MVQLNFNAQEVAPSSGFQVYPSGTYDVMINGSEKKPTKAKIAGTAQKGAYIQLSLRITGGEAAGGTLIARLNFENDNPQAEEIGHAELSAICRVCGVMQLNDTQQLHGIPFKVVVAKVERNDKPGEYGNEIKSYMDVNGNGPETAGQGAVGGDGAFGAPATAQAAAPVTTAPQPQAAAVTPAAESPPAEVAPVTPAPAVDPAVAALQEQLAAAQAAAPVAQPAAPAAAETPAAATAPPWAQKP